ncbi:MAG: 7-carboxy-7-deazaguanine synthase [Alphaproteobacteria bacterium]|nr:7-carboxy-7-deazaguanine synthase [Alphaproteobacteria bacterium]
MSYAVKEIYYTLQGEGAQTGRPAVFCRFAGCNLWSGLEKDRATAQCNFCDTDFVGTDGQNGGKFDTPEALAEAIIAQWPTESNNIKKETKNGAKNATKSATKNGAKDAVKNTSLKPYVVFTGGEPLLQLDEDLLIALKAQGFATAIETNGTLIAPNGLDWICVSPKPQSQLKQTHGDELKFVYPQDTLSPDMFSNMDFKHFFIQPMALADPEKTAHNMQAATLYCLQNPQWRLSLQTHKLLGLD